MNKSIKIYGLHDRINEVIKDSGLDVKQFSKKCGLDRKIFSYEVYTLRTIFYICSAYHVSADWLLFGKGEKYGKAKVDDKRHDKEDHS